MSQTRKQIEAALTEAGSHPRKQFGQNFMVDQNLVRLVAQAGELSRDDVVIEVGPGTGTLTEELLELAGRVIAVEIDRDLASMLRKKFSDRTNFELSEGDALDGKHAINPKLIELLGATVGTPPVPLVPIVRDSETHARTEYRPWHPDLRFKLVANLPYNIASPLVIELLTIGCELLAFTVQKEVGERLKSQPNTDGYGPLSVMAQLLGSVEVLRTLPPSAFWPPPKIDSALVRIRAHKEIPLSRNQVASFSQFIHRLFSYRRKTLRRALIESDINADIVLEKTKLDPSCRSETLTLDQLLALFANSTTTPTADR